MTVAGWTLEQWDSSMEEDILDIDEMFRMGIKLPSLKNKRSSLVLSRKKLVSYVKVFGPECVLEDDMIEAIASGTKATEFKKWLELRT